MPCLRVGTGERNPDARVHVHAQALNKLNGYGIAVMAMSDASLWLENLLACVVCVVPVVACQYYQFNYWPSHTDRIRYEAKVRLMKRRRRRRSNSSGSGSRQWSRRSSSRREEEEQVLVDAGGGSGSGSGSNTAQSGGSSSSSRSREEPQQRPRPRDLGDHEGVEDEWEGTQLLRATTPPLPAPPPPPPPPLNSPYPLLFSAFRAALSPRA